MQEDERKRGWWGNDGTESILLRFNERDEQMTEVLSWCFTGQVLTERTLPAPVRACCVSSSSGKHVRWPTVVSCLH